MRKEFAEFLHGEMSYNENIVLITGDLGYGLWDRIKIDYSDRFYNVMSSEQLMVGTAVGLAMEGFIPLVYGRAEVGLPLTGLSVFFEGSLLAIDDSKVQDYQAGIAWELIDNLAVDVAIKAGYRQMTLELDDIDDIYTDLDASGPFAGIQVHF